MAEDMGEKTEAPTSRRLEESRSKGSVAKSPDLSGAVDLIGAAILLSLLGGTLFKGCAVLMQRLLHEHASLAAIEPVAIGRMLLTNFGDVVQTSAIIMVLVLLVAVGAQFMQVGVLFTLKPVTPDLARLDPVKGVGRVFGKKGLIKTGVNTLKLSAAMLIGFLVVRSDLDKVVALPTLSMTAAMASIGAMALELACWLLVLMLVIGIVDYVHQRRQHHEELKMTKQEVRDERRSMEGDPEIKGRRLRMAREIAMQRINSAVPQADVIVTNPTHFSVALRYDAESMGAPTVVAKGADDLAFRIREIARAHGVPIVERPPLARALYHGVDVGREIAPEFYQAVAELLAYVFRLNQSGAAPPRPRPGARVVRHAQHAVEAA